MENKIDMSGNVNFIGTQEEWDALVEKNKLRLSAMKKQTAVEWLIWEMSKIGLIPDGVPDELYQQVIAMEKEQMKDFVTTFLSSASPAVNSFIRDEFEKYYNETYNK